MADNLREKIGRYEILGELGRGAMGVVFKARDPNIDRIVAIKAIQQSEFTNAPEGEEMQERFRREVQTAGLLTHSNIVTVYDGGVDDQLHWIAMEFIDGPSLKQIITERKELKLDQAASIVAKVCSAMEFAHKRQIIHRDLKPANILMNTEGEPKVTDFGIARIESSTMTKTGVILGTPSYMSPEQVTGQRIDFRSDIFSLGIILYELLTGERPFTGENPTSIMYKIVHTDPVPPDRLDPTLPEELSAVTMRALAKRPNQRFASAGEMAETLLAAVGKDADRMVGTGRLTLETTQLNSERIAAAFDRYEKVDGVQDFEPRKRRVLPVLLVILLLAIIAGGTYLWVIKEDFGLGIFASTNNDVPATTSIEKPLTIKTNVEDAVILVDGQPTEMQPDGSILLSGEQGAVVNVQVQKDCFETATESIVLSNAEPLERTIDLVPRTRIIRIVTQPEDAEVILNGENRGTAPLEVELRCGETYSFQATASGFSPFEEEFQWDDLPDEGPLTLLLEPIIRGEITFTGPYRVKVSNADGRPITNGEVQNLKLQPGTYNINLTNRDVFLNITRSIVVEAEGRYTVELPELGVLTVTAFPSQCTVTINGFRLDTGTELPMLQRKVASGEVRVEFIWDNYREEKTIVLEPGEIEQRVAGTKPEAGGER